MMRKFLFCPLAILMELFLTFLLAIPVFIFALLYKITPTSAFGKVCHQISEKTGMLWARLNHFILVHLLGVHFHVKGLESITPNKNYFIICNHQSWADILVLEEALRSYTGFSRYFIKKNLLHVPLVGWACWALNFPYMYRFTKTHLAQHPEDKGKDVAITKNACQKLRNIYFKLNNFPEGTRFTTKKHQMQKSPFQHLLKPKSGGISYALQILHDQFDSILDMTIFYHQHPSIISLFSGRIREITVVIRKLPISADLLGDYQNDQEFRASFHQYMNALWVRKDQLLMQLHHQNKTAFMEDKPTKQSRVPKV